MTGSLLTADVEQYQQAGFLSPYAALDPGEVAYYRDQLEAFEAAQGAPLGRLPGQVRAKTHLLFTWMADLVRHPKVLDAVESLIGPDVLVYHVTCWIKDPGDGSYVTWHQDGAYFQLTPAEHVTAWIALSDASPESGCMRVLPGSHHRGALPHTKGDTRGNLLSNGQQVPDVDDHGAVHLPVPAGHFSLHHTHILHASGPNHSDHRRIGIGVSYVPTRVRFSGDHRVTASLVRGEDRFGHFDLEPSPQSDFDRSERKFHAAAVQRFFSAHGSKRTEDEGVAL